MEKSFISLFMMTPVSGTQSCEPKSRFIVVVREMDMPVASAVTTWDVPWLVSLLEESSGRIGGGRLTRGAIQGRSGRRR